ncbi:MAG: M15 family metallopeptidase [Aquimonas sp.]|nr:M15 family metallopeptidase [Aquimonas sp.]
MPALRSNSRSILVGGPPRGGVCHWLSQPRYRVHVCSTAAVSVRSTAARRALSAAQWCLRDPETGTVLALWSGGDWQPTSRPARARLARLSASPARDLAESLRRALGIQPSNPALRALPRTDEARSLRLAGGDRYGRPLLLDARAARAFKRMCAAARLDGVVLEVVSGFRGLHHQAGIFRRKLARGQTLDEILRVNAPPGYSEHHSGRALDLSCPDEPPAEESFETTAAFAWLGEHAARFGFVMSYPRNNPHGIAYEPWHWCWHPPRQLR